jgi:hypothetical protein
VPLRVWATGVETNNAKASRMAVGVRIAVSRIVPVGPGRRRTR